MKLKDLEKAINEKIEEEKIGKARQSDLTYNVRRIVYNLIGDNKEIYVSDYAGNVYIRKSCSGRTYEITIKIKKKKIGTEYERFYGYVTLYKIDKVEVLESEDFDSIEGFIEYCNKREEEKENYEKSKTEKFERQLSDINIDFKMFYEMMENYKNLSYNEKSNLARKYGGKDYYKYF